MTTNENQNLSENVLEKTKAEREVLQKASDVEEILEAELQAANNAKDAEIQPVCDRLREIEAVHNAKINDIKGKMRANRLSEKSQAYQSAVYRAQADEAMKMTGRFDAQTFSAYLKGLGIRVYRLEELPKLKNGVQLFRHYEAWRGEEYKDALGVAHFALEGTKIIAFQMTRKAAHAGDRADYNAWIGKSDLLCQNQSFYIEDIKYSWAKNDDDLLHSLEVMRFKMWKAAVESLPERASENVSGVVPVNVTNKSNIVILGQTEAKDAFWSSDFVDYMDHKSQEKFKKKLLSDPSIPHVFKESK